MNNTYLNPYVVCGIDKITLGMDQKYLTCQMSPPQLQGIIDIVSHGNWRELNIQNNNNGWFFINAQYPLFSVINALRFGINAGIFMPDVTNYIMGLVSRYMIGWLAPYGLINTLFYSGLFKLDEYELFFDFVERNAIISIDENGLRHHKNSYYTKDHKVKRRVGGRNKGVRRSLLCIYDRGLRIGSPLPIERIEFRICDDRARSILEAPDLLYPVNQFIDAKGGQIKSTLKRYLPQGSITFNDEYVCQSAPLLPKLILLLDK
jgi:hypothetical protein